MLQKYNMWNVLRVFFDDPVPEGAGFALREISRKAGIAPPSVKRYLEFLCKKGGHGFPLVIKGKPSTHGPVYWANRASELFLFYKKVDMLTRLEESGILRYISETCLPKAIILFGSAAKGEDVQGSDIDLYLQCRERKLDLLKFEKQLNRKINILFEPNYAKLSDELKNNLINGIIVKGYLKVF